MSETSTGRLVAAEFVGTTIVMLGGPGLIILGSASVGPLGVAVGFGLSIAIAIGVIGAVANPMFSIALWFSRSITTREVLADMIGQLLGGVFGAAVIFGLNDTNRFTRGVNGWDHSGFGELGVVLGAELVLGTIAVVVLLSSISQQRSNGAVAAFTGAAYALGSLFLLDISGVGVNPARSVGAAVFADTDPNAIGQVWAFVVTPIVAAVTATIVWLVIDDATIDETLFDDSVLEDLADVITGDD